MNSTDTYLFLKVAQTLSFKEAAEQLGMSRSAISKRVAMLEKELGTALVNRTPRSISLTEGGQIFARHCQDIDDSLERATQAVQRRDQVPSGILRTSLPTGLGAQLMPALMSDFNAQYPDIRMVAHFGEPFVDIVTGAYDVVIRVAERLTDSALMARRLATSPRLLVASPDYLEKQGTPVNVRDLSDHRCLGLGYRSATAGQWRFVEARNAVVDVPVKYHFTSNNDLALILAACLGTGIFYTTEVLVQNELKRGRLVPVLPDVCRRIQMGVFAVYPQKQPAAKVRAFIDFVEGRIAELETADRWTPLRSSDQ